MSDPKEVESSTDTRGLSMISSSHGILTNFLTNPRKTLKDNLNPRNSLPFRVLDLATNHPNHSCSSGSVSSESSNSTTNVTNFLNKKGQIDANKLADLLITRSLNEKSSEMSHQFQHYQQTRILENPPILKNRATYLDYYNWIDPMLSNLKRHPDFMYQFLIYNKPSTSTPEDQLRLDQIYQIIKDKLDYSVSQNPKLQGLLTYYPSPDDISQWWLLLQGWFFSNNEREKQSRELRFYQIWQKVDETNEDFIQRMFLEAEILKYCGQDVSEARLRCCINVGLTDKIHHEYAAIQDQLPFDEWINYAIKLEQIHKPNRIDPLKGEAFDGVRKDYGAVVAAVQDQSYKTVAEVKKDKSKHVKDSKESRSSNIKNKFKSKSYNNRQRNDYKETVPDSSYICWTCMGGGHFRSRCPHKNKPIIELVKIKESNQRQRDSNRRRSETSNDYRNNEHVNKYQNYKNLASKQVDEAEMEIQEDQDESKDPQFVAVIIESRVQESLMLIEKSMPPQKYNNPIFDSGATRHMFNNLAHFTDYVPNTNNVIQVEVAQGTRIQALGTGNVGPLKNVLYIPDLKFSVISISNFDNQGYHILFGKGLVTIFDEQYNIFLKGTKDKHGLYVLQQQILESCFKINPVVCLVHQYSDNPYLRIHACLGHASARRTRYVCQCHKLKGIKSLSQNAFQCIKDCNICYLSKSAKRSFPGHTPTSTRPGEAWQFDVKGTIAIPSLVYGAHYEYGFIDKYSRKLFTYYTTNKDDNTTVEVFKTWYKNVIVPLRAADSTFTKVFVHSDLGELSSQAAKDFATEHGIYLTYTAAYTPELNSIIERVWRTITDSAVAMLLHARLSESYWQFARQTAVYIYNAIPGAHPETQPLSPDERFYGVPTSINHLQIFGSTCYVKIMKKFKDHQPKAERGIFVGYPIDQPACYKVFMSGPPHKVVVSTHVQFVDILPTTTIQNTTNNNFPSSDEEPPDLSDIPELVDVQDVTSTSLLPSNNENQSSQIQSQDNYLPENTSPTNMSQVVNEDLMTDSKTDHLTQQELQSLI